MDYPQPGESSRHSLSRLGSPGRPSGWLFISSTSISDLRHSLSRQGPLRMFISHFSDLTSNNYIHEMFAFQLVVRDLGIELSTEIKNAGRLYMIHE